MKTLRQCIEWADTNKVALGHFNTPNISIIDAVINAAIKLDVPVLLGFSEGERDFFGTKEAVAYVKTAREDKNHPIFVNADHTYSIERVKEAVDAGFDSIVWDGAEKGYKENRDMAKEAVEYARQSGKDIVMEAELGFIGSGSSIKDVPPEGVAITEEHMTKPEEAKRFVEETGIDLLAPAVGNLHGVLKGGSNPHISPERVREVREAAGVPLVLHGGSGISDDDFKKGIAAGISQVHVSTELRIAYRKAVEESLKEDPDQLAPYKIMKPVVEAVQKVVEEKLRLFNNI